MRIWVRREYRSATLPAIGDNNNVGTACTPRTKPS